MTSTSAKAPTKRLPAQAAKPAPTKKPAPAKKAVAPKLATEQKQYAATARSGKANTRRSTTVLTHALDVKIANRKGAQFAAGVICGFFASKEKAQAAADNINGGNVADWSDAIVVTAKAVS